MNKYIILFFIILLSNSILTSGRIMAQSSATDSIRSSKIYPGNFPYPVETYKDLSRRKKPKNIILMIGDGMGISHITGAMVANGGGLFLRNLKHTGFATTNSASDFITDSGAGGTALATGNKTCNGMIGVGSDILPLVNIREILAGEGKSTGVVVTSSITHATPAAFVAHQPDREMHYNIALDIVRSGIDLFVGGGLQYFIRRPDSLNLITQLENDGYLVDTTSTNLSPKTYFFHPEEKSPVAFLYADQHPLSVSAGRGNFLPAVTTDAIAFLNHRGRKGFFLMVEGSQIDWGGHDNNTSYIISEMLDFDRAVGEALKFAASDGKTLVIVTADHETGGFAIHDGNPETGSVTARFTSTDHTATMVPVFAFGPGSEYFCGICDNTDIPKRILKAMKIRKKF